MLRSPSSPVDRYRASRHQIRLRCNTLIQSAACLRATSLTYDEAMAICLLLAEAADAVADDDQLRDTWAEEARLMIELVLNRTDD